MVDLSRSALRATGKFLESYSQEGQHIDKQLLHTFGCPYNYGPSIVTPSASQVSMVAAADCLPRILVALVERGDADIFDITSVLAGLYVNKCWSSCLGSEDGAYALASGAVWFVQCYLTTSDLCRAALPGVLAILNEWLRPDVEWKVLPTKTVLCEHMFGEPWCHFSLPQAGSAGRSTDLDPASIIRRDRPPFLPGLCAVQSVDACTTLPDIDQTL